MKDAKLKELLDDWDVYTKKNNTVVSPLNNDIFKVVVERESDDADDSDAEIFFDSLGQVVKVSVTMDNDDDEPKVKTPGFPDFHGQGFDAPIVGNLSYWDLYLKLLDVSKKVDQFDKTFFDALSMLYKFFSADSDDNKIFKILTIKGSFSKSVSNTLVGTPFVSVHSAVQNAAALPRQPRLGLRGCPSYETITKLLKNTLSEVSETSEWKYPMKNGAIAFIKDVNDASTKEVKMCNAIDFHGFMLDVYESLQYWIMNVNPMVIPDMVAIQNKCEFSLYHPMAKYLSDRNGKSTVSRFPFERYIGNVSKYISAVIDVNAPVLILDSEILKRLNICCL